MSYYTNKWIWITGASAGIGEQLVYAFHQAGANLIISARREEELLRVAANCKEAAKVQILTLDLEKISELTVKAQQALTIAGNIDILVNNGGISQRGRAVDTQDEVDERIMKINYHGTRALTRAVLPGMIQHGSGQIAVITSLTGKFSTPFRSSYAASKHALHGFFEGLRAEVYSKGIHVCMICPGFIQTDVSKNALDENGNPRGIMDNTTANGMKPEELARRVLKVLARRKNESWIGGKEVLMAYIHRFFPNLYRRLIRKVAVV